MAEHLDAVRRGRLLLNRLDRWLLDEVRPDLGQRVLDMGCGHGNLMALLADRELVVGTDVDPKSVALVRDRFRANANMRAHVFDALQPPAQELIDYRVDTVISLNVLEHIERDNMVVRNLIQLFAWGKGALILIVPAFMGLYGPMDAALGHYRRYTKTSMRAILEPFGLRIRRQFYHNLAGAVGWWFAGRVLRHKIPPDGQLTSFNRLVPLLAWIERRVRPPFGLSLVTVATLSG